MTTWYLFRHALATENKDGYGDEILTAKILPVGVPPIERMAEYIQRLPKSVNWSSELLRCAQTTNIITKITGRTFISDARLNEYYNETFEAFRKRIASWLDEMMTRHPPVVLVCTHGAVIAGLKHLLLEGEYLESQTLDYPKCGQLLIISSKTVFLVPFDTVMPQKLYYSHAKTRLSAEEEKKNQKARVSRADENRGRQECPQTEKAYRKKEAHGLTHAPQKKPPPLSSH